MKRNSLLVVILLITTFISGQKPPIKFGKISNEELAMTTYGPDTSAAAVVLCKYGFFDAGTFRFKRIERIKVLKKNGVRHAAYILPGRWNDTFRGRTYNIVNGEVIIDKLDRESIYKERVTETYFRYRVALPNVKVGSVFELEYSTYAFPAEWTFQSSIPINWCELVLESTNIEFRKRAIGYEPLSYADGKRFVAKNMPAFKPEPYINSQENYITKFEFDVARRTNTWEVVNELLLDSPRFGHVLNFGSGYINQVADSIEQLNLSPVDKSKAAFEAVKQINWNHEEWLFCSSDILHKPYRENIGNSTDINFILIHLLRKLDIEAHPFVISTRENGILNTTNPSLIKLNYAMVYASINDKEYLLDATEKELTFGMLPTRCLNEKGRVITKKQGKWVDIKPPFKNKETIYYELSLDEDTYELKGKISYNRKGYAAYNLRKEYKKYADNEEYISHLETSFTGLIINKCEIENIDKTDEPVRDTYHVVINNHVEQANSLVMITPFFLERIQENPFKIEDRKYPIDFAYCQSKNVISSINIPKNYDIINIPEPIHIVSPDKSISIFIQHQYEKNKLTTIYKFNINKSKYLPNDYKNIKTLYEQLIKKQAEPFILKQSRQLLSNT